MDVSAMHIMEVTAEELDELRAGKTVLADGETWVLSDALGSGVTWTVRVAS